jgi:hypothetical protein
MEVAKAGPRHKKDIAAACEIGTRESPSSDAGKSPPRAFVPAISRVAKRERKKEKFICFT